MRPSRTTDERIKMAVGLIVQARIELSHIESDDPKIFDPVFTTQHDLMGIAERLRVASHFEKSNG